MSHSQHRLKLTSEDVWKGCSYVLSVKMSEPQFADPTKERQASSETASFVRKVVRDSFELWQRRRRSENQRIYPSVWRSSAAVVVRSVSGFRGGAGNSGRWEFVVNEVQIFET